MEIQAAQSGNSNSPKTVKPFIFVSYAHEDSRWFEKGSLMPRLIQSLQRVNAEIWYDKGRIGGADIWKDEIENAIDRSDIAILLVSQYFINSKFIMQVELPRLIKKANEKQLVIFPILVGYCDWESIDAISRPQMMPGEPTPLVEYLEPLAKWEKVQYEIFQALQRQIKKILAEPGIVNSGLGHSVSNKDEARLLPSTDAKSVESHTPKLSNPLRRLFKIQPKKPDSKKEIEHETPKQPPKVKDHSESSESIITEQSNDIKETQSIPITPQTIDNSKKIPVIPESKAITNEKLRSQSTIVRSGENSPEPVIVPSKESKTMPSSSSEKKDTELKPWDINNKIPAPNIGRIVLINNAAISNKSENVSAKVSIGKIVFVSTPTKKLMMEPTSLGAIRLEINQKD